MKTPKLRSITVVLALALPSLAHAQDLPSLRTIAQRLAVREKLFNNIDAHFAFDMYDPNRNTPVFEISCRWVKHNDKMLIDFQDAAYLEPDKQDLRLTKLSYDGRTARVLSVVDMKARVFRDWPKHVPRNLFYGPDIMGISLPMAQNETVCSLLTKTQISVPMRATTIPRFAKVTAKKDMHGLTAFVVDVTTGQPPHAAEIIRLYLAEDYGYAVLQAEHYMIDTGQTRLMSRIKMNRFQLIKKNLWYPTTAKYDVFQGRESPLQTTVFRTEEITWPEKFDESLFALDFPPGTHVFDTVTGIDYIAGGPVHKLHLGGQEPLEIYSLTIEPDYNTPAKNTPPPSAQISPENPALPDRQISSDIATHQPAPPRKRFLLCCLLALTVTVLATAILIIRHRSP
jgi:hypothetical protein